MQSFGIKASVVPFLAGYLLGGSCQSSDRAKRGALKKGASLSHGGVWIERQ